MPGKSWKKKTAAPPDPAREAMKARQEEDRRRREAEFAARGQEWAARSPEFAAAYERDLDGRLKGPTVEEVREQVGREEEQCRAAEWAAYQEQEQHADEIKAKIADFERRVTEARERRVREAAEDRQHGAERQRHRKDQADRDQIYVQYLLSIGARTELYRELLRQLTAIPDRDYGQPGHKVYHSFTPGDDWYDDVDGDDPAPYAVLGLEPGASFDEVKAAWRQLVMRCHPDKGGDAAEFRRVQAAYEAIEERHRAAG